MIRAIDWQVAMQYARTRARHTGRRQVVTKAAGYHLAGHYVPPTWTVQEFAEAPRHRLPVYAR